MPTIKTHNTSTSNRTLLALPPHIVVEYELCSLLAEGEEVWTAYYVLGQAKEIHEEHPAGVKGKFLFAGGEKLYVRGVTYVHFRPSEDGAQYHSLEVIERDFAQIAANGFNVVRTYTVTPPRWFLDNVRQVF